VIHGMLLVGFEMIDNSVAGRWEERVTHGGTPNW